MRKIHLDKDWGLFVGKFENNDLHRHYAIQLSIGIEGGIQITDGNGQVFQNEHWIIKDNIEHQLKSSGNHILILFNPFSQVGHYLQIKGNQAIYELNESWIDEILKMGNKYLNGDFKFEVFIENSRSIINDIDCSCLNDNHVNDDRINKSITYLQTNSERIIPVEEIAGYLNLSVSRFLHLFKVITGMTYRRAQLWNKIQSSLGVLKNQSITETAHQFGFADSAHYSRVFKENFGFSPKFISKM